MVKTYVVEVELNYDKGGDQYEWVPSRNLQHRKNRNVFKTLKQAEKGIKTHTSPGLKYRIITERKGGK